MATRKKLQKAFALLLVASMTMSLLSVGAFATDESVEDAVKLSSVELPAEYQGGVSVKYGTAEENLGLPETLTGTVVQEMDPPVEEVLLPDEGEAQPPVDGSETQPPVDGGETQPPVDGGETQPPVDGGETQPPVDGGETQPPVDGGETQAPDNGVMLLMDTKMSPAPEETVEVPVTWSCDTYDGWTAGDYTFTATLGSGFEYEEPLPTITVTVEPSTIPEDYIITPETADPNAVLKQAKENAQNALILAGTYKKGFTVDGITLYVAGEVSVNGGLTLKDATLTGYTSNDVLNINETSATTVKTAELNSLTVNITGSVHNYLLNWESGNFELNDAVLSASGNDKGCGMFVGGGTAGSMFIANDSDVSFCDNIQGNGGSGIWANADGNSNPVFVFTDSSLKLNNNGLNGFMGAPASYWGGTTPLPTFTFINTNVEAIGNGSSEDDGEGDGFSYGYITLENTDGGNYIFDVSGNDNNGLDGGRSNNAALDAKGYHIIANDNGNYGICISKLNAGKAESTIENCTVQANGNGSNGMYVQQPMQVIDSIISTNENNNRGVYFFSSKGNLSFDETSSLIAGDNSGSGLYFYGASLLAKAGSEFQLCGNHSSGLNIARGEAALQDCKVTITNNSNLGTSSYSKYYGGGIYNAGTLSLSADAEVYNNHASTAADDIYCTDKASLVFGQVGSTWKLDDCGDAIDGWYDDSTNARWEAHKTPSHVQEFDEFDSLTGLASVSGKALFLKAAHSILEFGQTEWQVSKSKTATNLEKQTNKTEPKVTYTSEVTLGLPSAEVAPVTDVVFVLDRSSSSIAADAKEALNNMLDELAGTVGTSEATIRVGVVGFDYTADVVLPLTNLTAENLDAIKVAVTDKTKSGTNIQAGIEAGVAMLAADKTISDDHKYLVLLTDGISHAWNDADGLQTIWGEGTADYSEIFNGANSYLYFDTAKTSFASIYALDADDPALNSSYEVPVYKDDGTEMTAADLNGKYIPKNEYDLYLSGTEKGVYMAAHAYAEAAAQYRCISVYWNNRTDDGNYPVAEEFMRWTGSQGKAYDITSSDMGKVFEDVQKNILYVVDEGSEIVDVIGYGKDDQNNDYNFDFVNDLDRLTLTVGGQELDKAELVNPQANDLYATSAYGFGANETGYDFVVTYYANGRDGHSDECFVWTINVPVTNAAPVELTYVVELMNPQTKPGTYGTFDPDGSNPDSTSLLTNLSATLYPVDSNQEEGSPEVFARPTVSYTVKRSGGGGGGGDTGGGGGDTDIPDENTPTTDLPEEPETPPEEPVIDVEDPDVPLAEVPKTGDSSAIWLALSALSGTGLAGVTLLGRKKKEQE